VLLLLAAAGDGTPLIGWMITPGVMKVPGDAN